MAFNQNFVFNGLGTLAVTVTDAGPYFVKGKSELPSLVGGAGASSLVVTVKVNNSTKYTGSAGALGFYTDLLLAANDEVEVVFTSSASTDAAYNAVKTNVQIGSGV